MFFLIFLFFTCIYPYLIYHFFYNTFFLKQKNKIISDFDTNNKQFQIFLYLKNENQINPFYQNDEKPMMLDITLTFCIDENLEFYEVLYEHEKIIDDDYIIFNKNNKNYIQFNLNISKNSEFFNKLIKYIKIKYPTYSNILFYFIEHNPFILLWFYQNKKLFNKDTVRNYFLVDMKHIVMKDNCDLQLINNDLYTDMENTNILEYYDNFLLINKFSNYDDITFELI
jgi:hypothetical protein